jgi:hypothetical protein
MSNLVYKIGTGNHRYVACVVGPEPKPEAAVRIPALRAFNLSDPFPAEGLVIDVPDGAVNVTAALRDLDGDVPSGVNVSITRPDGSTYTQSTGPNAEGTVVQEVSGSLVGLLVAEPEPGQWKIEITSTNEEDEFAFWFGTMPTGEVQSTIDQTLTEMADPDALPAIEAEFAEGESWGCFWCKVGCAALGVVVAALIAAGATFITAGAAGVVALAALLSWAATTVVAVLTGVAAAGAATLGIVIAYICTWSKACPATDETAEAAAAAVA